MHYLRRVGGKLESEPKRLKDEGKKPVNQHEGENRRELLSSVWK